jgi:phosphoribosylformylglycinamidine synthase
MLKKGILDNAGKATTKALSTLGFDGVNDVRIGKTIEFTTDSDPELVAKKFVNQVMEDYKIEEIK